LLRDNDLGIVDNPPLYRDRAELERDASTFHHDHELANDVSAKAFIYGALLAQDEEYDSKEQGHNDEDQDGRDALDRDERDASGQGELDAPNQDKPNALDQDEWDALRQEKAPKLKE